MTHLTIFLVDAPDRPMGAQADEVEREIADLLREAYFTTAEDAEKAAEGTGSVVWAMLVSVNVNARMNA